MRLDRAREEPALRPDDRCVLFLQGIASPFFAQLGRDLKRSGCRIRRINLCLGDALFWRGDADLYRGDLQEWHSHLSHYLERHGVTDMCLFGDTRPYHRVAIRIAELRGINVHVFEEGYLRPHWITHELGGTNGNSRLPRCPDTIRARAVSLPAQVEAQPVRSSMLHRAGWEIAFHLATMAGRIVHPHYRHHRPYPPMVEFRGWVRRLSRRKEARSCAERSIQALLERKTPFFLVPLQLDADSQIRTHSPFADVGAFLERVFASFARHAPENCELLVKVHPLDNGLVDRDAQCAALAAKHGLTGRVVCVDGGDLGRILKASRGVVLVNSTVGVSALEAGRPVVALGTALYDLPGLSHQNGLDDFWTSPQMPDPEMLDAYRRVVIHETQVNGSFFSPKSLARAASLTAQRIMATDFVPRPNRALEGTREVADVLHVGEARPLAPGE